MATASSDLPRSHMYLFNCPLRRRCWLWAI